jgi:chaperonin cofactor prefoldin
MFEAEKEASKTALETRKQTLEVERLRDEKADLEKHLKELEKKLGKGSPHREE